MPYAHQVLFSHNIKVALLNSQVHVLLSCRYSRKSHKSRITHRKDGRHSRQLSAYTCLSDIFSSPPHTKVKKALQHLPGVDNVTVQSTDDGPSGGREWLITFSGSKVKGNIPLLAVDNSGLTGSGVRTEATEITAGNEPTGRFMLQADTAPQGWPEHRSGWIRVGSSASAVEAAVLEIPGVRAVDVTVNTSVPTIGAISWEITFSHRQQVEDEGELHFVATGQSGDRKPLRVVTPQLSGAGTEVHARTVQDGGRSIRGTFEVYIQGNAGASATVANGASAPSVRTALVDGLGLPATTEVTRLGPLADNLAFTYTVTLPEGTTLWNDAGGTILGNASRLTGQNAFVRIELVRQGVLPLGGKFNITLGVEGEPVSVAYNSTDEEVADAVSSFSVSGGNASVSHEAAQNDDGSIDRRWLVTFSALSAAGDVPTISVNGSGMLIGEGVHLFVVETLKGVTADMQEVTINGYNGTYSIFTESVSSFNSSSPTNSSSNLFPASSTHSSPVSWNASSADVSAAIFEATGKRTHVQRAPTSEDDSGGFKWLILFAEALHGTWGTIGVNTTHLVPDDKLLAGYPRQAKTTSVRNSTVDIIGGKFTLSFGQRCENRAGGAYCSVATSEIEFDASADQIVSALAALPAIHKVSVTGSSANAWGGVGKVAPNGYGVSSGGLRFSVNLTHVILNASDSAVAEYWQSTWSPKSAAREWSADLATEGDLPLLGVDVSGITGSRPTGRAIEVTKGLSTEIGGIVTVEVSQNAGRDYTSSSVTYVYEPSVFVNTLVPDHGPIFGGTQVRDCLHVILVLVILNEHGHAWRRMSLLGCLGRHLGMRRYCM